MKKSFYPAFFVEITCITSPHPNRRGTVEVPRVALANSALEVRGSFGSADFEPGNYFPRVREIELLFTYEKYRIVMGLDGRYFISFTGVSPDNDQDFLRYARNEIARVNQVISTLVPLAEDIVVQKTIYMAENETSMSEHSVEPDPIAGPYRFETVNESAIVERWKSAVEQLIANPSRLLFTFLEKDGRDPILTTCVNLMSRNDFPSYYTALELIVQHYGGQHISESWLAG